MGHIKPMDFLKFFIDQGYYFQIATMDDDEVNDDWMVVNKDNFEEYKYMIESKKSSDSINR